MLIGYTIGQGFWFAPTVPDIPDIKPLYDAWGETGLHYIGWFSHPFSPQTQLTDLKDRDEAVISELRQRGLGQAKRAGGPMSYPAKLYESDHYAAAESALLGLPSLPSYTQLDYLRKSLAEYQSTALKMKLNPAETDPDKINKQIKGQLDMQELIKKTAKELADQEDAINDRLGVGGLISMDVIWNSLQTH